MTFRCYLALEHGESLPKPQRLQAILLALGLGEHASETRELVDAYFASQGLTPLMRLARVQESSAAGPGGLELAEMAARQAARRISAQLSLEQWKLQAQNYEAYVCKLFLATTPGGASFPELAKMTGLEAGAVKRAVRALAAAGLAEVSKNRVRSPIDDKTVEPLPTMPATAGVKAALQKYRARLAKRGKPARTFNYYFRMTEANLACFNRHVDAMINALSIYDSVVTTEDSSVYLIQGEILKLFPR